MSRLSEMIKELCPDGVEYRKLEDVLKICNGSDYKKFGEGDIPVYGSGGIMTYIDTYVYDKPSVLIPRKGSLDKLYYVDVPFWTVDTIFYTKISEEVLPKYVFYYLQSQHLERLNKAGGVPSLTQTILNKVLIPVPPLPIQNEIVKLLDNFTDLTEELTAELVLRKKQYNFYRDSLLNFVRVDDTIVQTDRQTDRQTALRIGKIGRLKQSIEVEWKTLGDIGSVCMCKRILKQETNTEEGVPFYKIGTFGKIADSYISKELFLEYKEKYSYPRKGEILISAAGTIGRSVVYDGTPAYFQDSNIVWIANDESRVLNRYLYYFYSLFPWRVADGGTIARLYNDQIRQTEIPIPPLKVQQKIVSILDRFDTLCNDLTQGLPAEIAARKKQYEYYRDKLLTFRRKGHDLFCNL